MYIWKWSTILFQQLILTYFKDLELPRLTCYVDLLLDVWSMDPKSMMPSDQRNSHTAMVTLKPACQDAINIIDK